MTAQRIQITQESSLPVERNFAFLADHNQLSKLFGIPVKRIKDGIGDVNGVGSVRALGVSPLTTEETVVGLEPNTSIDYEITKGGGPLRKHHGRIDFVKTPQGSRVTWTITFESLPVVGSVVRKVLEIAIGRGLRTLA
jgi:hypothetical protein